MRNLDLGDGKTRDVDINKRCELDLEFLGFSQNALHKPALCAIPKDTVPTVPQWDIPPFPRAECFKFYCH